MWRFVALVKTDFSAERIASIIGMKRISKLGTLAVLSNWSTLRRNSYIPEDDILHGHRRENLKSYKMWTQFNERFGKFLVNIELPGCNVRRNFSYCKWSF
jgi:hypothetical protein